ncbi:poly(glycerol-phosphate) alpha-glucosyltransferase [Mammaliicoccus lentus]|uniref:poly(glycerol-phosphate) alpha-glucosyltransferase n=1 Tax=Mammaliicoccus lentus TaxID=42858 RepID=UPI00374FDA2A
MFLEKRIDKLLATVNEENLEFDISFLSLGLPNIKAIVSVLKRKKYLKDDILKACAQFKKKTGKEPVWIKMDIVTHTEQIDFNILVNDLEKTRRNYVDYGFSLDDSWRYAFLPEIINSNAFIRPNNKDKKLYLSEKNINNYLRKYTKNNLAFNKSYYSNKKVIKFYTKGFYVEEDRIIKLNEKGYEKNLRDVDNFHEEIDELIKQSVNYLKNEIQSNGKYIYGYFPHFDKKINFYNNLRHSSSTYALIEGLSYLNKDISVAKKPLNYIIENYLYNHDGIAYVFDDTKGINEIKLGQNAAFILAICEYLRHRPDDLFYLEIAQKVAKGIESMIDDNDAETIHVLHYPTLKVKEKYRIVYYDGEAAFALLRLYQVDGDENWLNLVKHLFEKFIKQNYWKYHDHWLSYCTNELVKLNHEEKYYIFGMKNAAGHLDYIKQRETTFPTFLEMLVATYKLVQSAKNSGFKHLVTEYIDERKLIDTIHSRANYQRTGYFYPEIVMYFKNPERIMNTFFIKHHGYRVRIDDVEHYISGYVQYQNVFKNNKIT